MRGPRWRGSVTVAEQSTHLWQSDRVETMSDSEHRCGQRLLRLLQGRCKSLDATINQGSAEENRAGSGPAWDNPVGAGSVLNPRPQGSAIG